MNGKNNNLAFIQALAPYRLDYYNYLYDNYGYEVWSMLRAFPDQLFSGESLWEQSHFPQQFLRTNTIFRRQIPIGVRKIIRQRNPNIVITPEFSILTMTLLLIRAFSKHKFKIISQCDDSYEMVKSKSFTLFHSFARRLLMPFIDEVILVDSRAVTWFQERYGKGIWMPIIRDEKKFTQNRALPQAKIKDSLSILFVGRFISCKNLECLITACSKLSFNYNLILVGDGPEKANLQQLADKLDIKVSFVGKKQGDELIDVYKSSEIFVLPSTIEAFGAVTNEALLCGCYVCISEKAGSACLVEESVNGVTFNPESPEELAKKITFLSRMETNTDRHSKMKISFSACLDNVMTHLNAL